MSPWTGVMGRNVNMKERGKEKGIAPVTVGYIICRMV